MYTLLLIDNMVLTIQVYPVKSCFTWRGKRGWGRNHLDRSLHFSFYCIRCLTTIILIGKKFIYINKSKFNHRSFKIDLKKKQKKRITVIILLWMPLKTKEQEMSFGIERSREVQINQAQKNNSDAALLSLPCKWSDNRMYKLKISGIMLPWLFRLKIISKELLPLNDKERWK